MNSLRSIPKALKYELPSIAIGAVLVGLVAIPVWPGIFTLDSLSTYSTGLFSTISNWYSPTIAWLWGRATEAGLPIPGALIIGVSLVVIGLIAMYRLVLGRWTALLATAITVLWPPIFGLLGWVLRDVWFAGLVLCSLAAVGWLARLKGRSWPLVFIAFANVWLASDARQNGFPALLILGGLALYLGFSSRYSRRIATVAALIGSFVLGPLSLFLVQRSVVTVHQHPEQVLLYQDLLAVSLHLNESQLSKSIFPSQDLDLVRKKWVPGNVGVTIFPADSPALFRPYENSDAVNDVVVHDWIQMVKRHPITYLDERLKLELLQLAIDQKPQMAFLTQSDESFGTEFRQDYPKLGEYRVKYLAKFGGALPSSGFLFYLWPYLLAGLVASILLYRARGALGFFGLSALLLQISLQLVLVLTATIAEFRFEFYQVVLGTSLLIMAVATSRKASLRAKQIEKSACH